MDETRKFFRFLMPGLVCVMQFLTAVWFTNPDLLNGYLGNGRAALSFAVTGFFASGALGYVLSSIYHTLHNSAVLPIFKPVDHGRCLQYIDNNMYKTISDKAGLYCFECLSNGYDLSGKDTVDTFTILWYKANEKDGIIEKIDKKTQDLASMKHGAGATAIGSILSFLAWLLLFLPGGASKSSDMELISKIHFTFSTLVFCLLVALPLILIEMGKYIDKNRKIIKYMFFIMVLVFIAITWMSSSLSILSVQIWRDSILVLMVWISIIYYFLKNYIYLRQSHEFRCNSALATYYEQAKGGEMEGGVKEESATNVVVLDDHYFEKV